MPHITKRSIFSNIQRNSFYNTSYTHLIFLCLIYTLKVTTHRYKGLVLCVHYTLRWQDQRQIIWHGHVTTISTTGSKVQMLQRAQPFTSYISHFTESLNCFIFFTNFYSCLHSALLVRTSP